MQWSWLRISSKYESPVKPGDDNLFWNLYFFTGSGRRPT